jgi:DNA modification methylase
MHYAVVNANQARKAAEPWLVQMALEQAVSFGLPEIDDRRHVWRVPLVSRVTGSRLGEVTVDARTSLIDESKSTRRDIIEARLLLRSSLASKPKPVEGESRILSSPRNTLVCGDAEEEIQDFPASSVDLVFTSPRYFSAKPEYSEYVSYEEYLLKMRRVIQRVHRVLKEGRFFVMNTSPILIRRSRRQESSKRVAVPFDLHRIFVDEGFDFIDDIIWIKPEGAGWALGRGRRFAADRNALQYKPATVTEYVLVYRKKSDKLIDWHIRNTPSRIVEESKIPDPYDRTNVWHIKPAYDRVHPAVFPVELAEKVIRYYSFKGDIVLDPFAGVGTVAIAAIRLQRRFVIIDINPEFMKEAQRRIFDKLGREASGQVLLVNCPKVDFPRAERITKYLPKAVED